MTNQKYKIGEKVLLEVEVIGFDGEHYICRGNRDEWYVGEYRMRPYTPKPEFEYGEVVEVSDGGKWQEAIFKSYLPDPTVGFPFFAHVRELCYPSWFSFCRKLQPKKELIEINGKKYDAEKVKERLADLKAEE